MKNKTLLVGVALSLIGGLAMMGGVNADVTVTHNSNLNVSYTLNGNENFSAGTITVTDGTDTITLLDRNLGATTYDTSNTGSYGYNFQWGNNYGFQSCYSNGCTAFPGGESTGSNQVTNAPHGDWRNMFYSGSTFIVGNQNWLNNNSVVDLWGGAVGFLYGQWNLGSSYHERMQGPCPKSFHVPNYKEMLKLQELFENSGTKMYNELFIPIAGYRNYSGVYVELGLNAYLWTSIPTSNSSTSSYALGIGLNGNLFYSFPYYRANAASVRCLYNTYESFRCDRGYGMDNDGVCVACTKPENSTYDKKGFCDWTCDMGYTREGNSCVACTKPENSTYDEKGSCDWTCDMGYTREGNSCVACTKPENSTYDEKGSCNWTCNNGFTKQGNVCVDPYHFDSDISYVLNGNEEFTGVGTITITDGTDTITILDRNLGAKISGKGCEDEDRDGLCSVDDLTYGYNFQRGNNYGFDPSKTPVFTTTKVSALSLIYNPLNQQYYSSGVFVKGGSNWLDDNSKIDLWGGTKSGSTDSLEALEDVFWSSNGDKNAWKVDSDTVKNRQGPCPENFHVPSIGELQKLIRMGNTVGFDVLRIPVACFRDMNGNVLGCGTYSYLWSSSRYYDYDNNPYASAMMIAPWGTELVDPGINEDGNRADAYSVRCFYDYYKLYTAPKKPIVQTVDQGFQTTIGGTPQSGMPTPTITTNTINQLNGKEVKGEVNVDFGSNTNVTFSHLAEVNIPVEGINFATVLVKHGGSSTYNYDGLTLNRNASCTNGAVTSSSDRYNGESIRVEDGYVTIYTCAASSFVALESSSDQAQILVTIDAGAVTIGVDTGASGSLIKNLGKVSVSNSDQILSGGFGSGSFWIEDMKGATSGYYTTLSVSDLSGDTTSRVIGKENVRLKPTAVSFISGAAVNESKVVLGANDTRNDWMTGDVVLTYFNRQNTAVSEAGRVGRWGDDLQVKVNIPAHTVADTYRGTITYTLYDLDQ